MLLNSIRACLKDIPDNLIFHLKRFDYDLVTGSRNKINDYFEFPMEVDMGPYDVEYLKDTSCSPNPDMFQLVGILVHTGNAEAGHYYSYIRERPGNSGTWIEFNDADVNPFDPEQINDQCFGGWSDGTYTGMAYPKSWNAYMLFYQRKSSMMDNEGYASQIAPVPVKVEIPFDLACNITRENEFWIRKYCLFDIEHARFCRSLLEQYRVLTRDICTEDHELERVVINVMMTQLERIFAREKECTELPIILDCLVRFAEKCSVCCKMLLEWILHHENSLRALFLRCPDEGMRKRASNIISSSLSFLRTHDPRSYGLESDESGSDSSGSSNPEIIGIFPQTIAVLQRLRQLMHVHAKSWDDFYGLLTTLAEFGPFECAVIHNADFLLYSLQILVVDHNKSTLRHWPHLGNFVRMSEKRRFSLRKLVTLVAVLLKVGQFDKDYISNVQDDTFLTQKAIYKFTHTEAEILRLALLPSSDKPPKFVPFLDRALTVDGIGMEICQEIVRTLLRLDASLSRNIYNTLLNGCSIDPAAYAEPYLQASLAFCETCPEHSFARQLIVRYARETQSIGSSGGDEHLDFFAKARRLQNINYSREKPRFFHDLILSEAPSFAPALLTYPDSTVRDETIKFLHGLLFTHNLNEAEDEIDPDLIIKVGSELCEACIKHVGELGRNNKSFEAARGEEIVKVIRHCLATYIESSEESSIHRADDLRRRAVGE